MILDLLLSSPLVAVAWIAALLLSLTIHEFSHAFVGHLRGDDTAEKLGRLTLNPLAHLDPVGTIMLVIVGFGWAKPVPFDPRKLKNPLWDGVAIAMAGPLSNLFLGGLAALAYRSLADAGMLDFTSVLPAFLVFLILVNMLLLFFNLIPIPPLDGSKVLEAVLVKARAYNLLQAFERHGSQILLILVIISLVTDINVFFFVNGPATLACDNMLGSPCMGALARYLGY
jgi:Zn-dependent protease